MRLFLLSLLLLSNESFSKMTGKELIENQFMHVEWKGPKKLAPIIKKSEKEPCTFLLKKMKEYKKTNFAKVRVMKTMNYLKCKENLSIAKQHLLPKTYFTVLAEAIRMSSNLPKKQRKEVVPLINIVKRKNKDNYIQKTIEEFEKSFKKKS